MNLNVRKGTTTKGRLEFIKARDQWVQFFKDNLKGQPYHGIEANIGAHEYESPVRDITYKTTTP